MHSQLYQHCTAGMNQHSRKKNKAWWKTYAELGNFEFLLHTHILLHFYPAFLMYIHVIELSKYLMKLRTYKKVKKKKKQNVWIVLLVLSQATFRIVQKTLSSPDKSLETEWS